MRKQNVWALCLMGMACLVSCNNEQEFSYMKTDSPLNLTAVQVKQSVQSRASSDNQWIGDGTEHVSVSDGSDAATYTVVNENGELQCSDENNQLYWASATEEQTVTAWYPATADNKLWESWTVKRDQSGDGYQQSDMMYANTKVALQGSHVLPFRHQTAKVIVHLLKNEVMAEELAGATVTIKNVALQGNVNEGALIRNEQAGVEDVNPKAVSPMKDYLASYEALLIPQLVKNKVFIEIKTTGGKTFTYKPKGNEGLLEGTYQNIYYVTVGKPGISVVVERGGLQWGQEGEDQIVDMTHE